MKRILQFGNNTFRNYYIYVDESEFGKQCFPSDSLTI